MAARAVRRPAGQHRPEHDPGRRDRARRRELAIANGYQLCVHAIGDRGNRETLDILRGDVQGASRRRRICAGAIEHAQHLSAADIPRFGQLGVIAAMQGIHCTSDAPVRAGAARARRAPEEGAYVWQKLMKSGAVDRNGTDAPVEDVDPIAELLRHGDAQAQGRLGVLPRPADDAAGRPEVVHDQRGLCGLRGGHQGLADGRQAGRHHRAVEGHPDGARGRDPLDEGALHDRRRQGAVRGEVGVTGAEAPGLILSQATGGRIFRPGSVLTARRTRGSARSQRSTSATRHALARGVVLDLVARRCGRR